MTVVILVLQIGEGDDKRENDRGPESASLGIS